MTQTYTAPQPFTDEKRPAIELKPVVSSQVKGIGYDEETKTLAVVFCHGAGAIYHYPNVEKKTFDAFMASESVGKFFGKHILGLPFTKYPPEPEAKKPE